MKFLKALILGLLIGTLLGLWVGMNIGKNKPWYSDPFADGGMTKKLKSSFGEGVEKAGESIEKMGEDIQGR